MGEVIELFGGAEVAVSAPGQVADVNRWDDALGAVGFCMACTRHDQPVAEMHPPVAADYGIVGPASLDTEVARMIAVGMDGIYAHIPTAMCGVGDVTNQQAGLCSGWVGELAGAAGLPKWVLVGDQAVRTWQMCTHSIRASSLTARQVMGRVGVWPGVGYVVAIPDQVPNQQVRKRLVGMLRQFDLMEKPLDWVGGHGCVNANRPHGRCGGMTWKMGRDGLEWCRGCWDDE